MAIAIVGSLTLATLVTNMLRVLISASPCSRHCGILRDAKAKQIFRDISFVRTQQPIDKKEASVVKPASDHNSLQVPVQTEEQLNYPETLHTSTHIEDAEQNAADLFEVSGVDMTVKAKKEQNIDIHVDEAPESSR